MRPPVRGAVGFFPVDGVHGVPTAKNRTVPRSGSHGCGTQRLRYWVSLRLPYILRPFGAPSLTTFRIEVIGPPGEADALLTRLQSAAVQHGFTVQGRGAGTGALSGVDTIIAVVAASTPVAVLIWEIVKHKQHFDQTNTPPVEFHVHLHVGSDTMEILEDDEATLRAAELLHRGEDDDEPDPV